MADSTEIAWCDSTFNPWIGCTKVGPGCDNCYAEADFDRRRRRAKWGAGQERSRTSAHNWNLPLRWNMKRFVECESCGWRGEQGETVGGNCEDCCPSCGSPDMHQTRRRVFCASLADVFDNEVPEQWRADLFALIAKTPDLDWLILTKRIGNASRMIAEATARVEFNDPAVKEWTSSAPWPHVWIGATVVNQEEAGRDITKLLAVPAAVRFLSMEPLLGPVNLRDLRVPEGFERHDGEWILHHDALSGFRATSPYSGVEGPRLDWVIVGGESGTNARPMHPDWARSLRDQCAAAGVPFLFKQWGEWAPAIDPPYEMQKFGKRAAGRRLDGVLHDGYPGVKP